jgi:ubiquinone/menaquinone biosynthesis C-methylase UbiE
MMNKRTYFNELASRWDTLPSPPDARERIARFVERMSLGEGGRILDVGCGTGVLVEHLRRVLPPSARIVELDLAEQMLRESARADPGAPVTRICADAARVPLAAESVDAVLCFNVLPHLGPTVAVMAELLRVLRPGGVVGVGHLMNSAEMNGFHAALGPPVADDYLPPASAVGDILRGVGGMAIVAEEHPGWYFVRALRA